MKTLTCFTALVLSLLLTACSDGLPKDDKGREDFLVFYDKFYADSIFQLQRAEFPLRGKDPDGQQDPFYWDVDNWRYLKSVKGVQGIELLPLVDMETWMRERIVIQERFLMEKRFTLINNKWFLTSYSGMAPLQ